MRRPAQRLRRLLALAGCALGLAAWPAGAHGPAPVALDALAVDADGMPTLLSTNVGLARRQRDGSFEYICPSRWDGNERAVATANDDGRLVLILSAGVAHLSADHGCTFEAITGPDEFVESIAPFGEVGFAVAMETLSTGERAVRAVDEAGARDDLGLDAVVDAIRWTALGLAASGHEPRPFLRVYADGSWTEWRAWDEALSRLTPRGDDGEAVWLLAQAADDTRLLRVNAEGEMAESVGGEFVRGPVFVDAEAYGIFDDTLRRADDGAFEAIAGDVPWTCLRQSGELAFACSLDGFLALSSPPDAESAPVATPVFDMRQLAPPRACGDQEARRACARDWTHFGGESGWLDTDPATTPGEPRPPMAGGCAAVPTASGSGSPAALFLALVVLGLRRSRTLAAGSAPELRRVPSPDRLNLRRAVPFAWPGCTTLPLSWWSRTSPWSAGRSCGSSARWASRPKGSAPPPRPSSAPTSGPSRWWSSTSACPTSTASR